MNEEIKSCPFCGGKATIRGKMKSYGFTIWCQCDECDARTTGYCPNLDDEEASVASIEKCKEKAIELWNKRDYNRYIQPTGQET